MSEQSSDDKSLQSFEISVINRTEDVDELHAAVVTWAKEDGWVIPLHDTHVVAMVDPGGCFIGRINGEIVTTICALNYDDSYCFIGAFLTKRAFRGKGLGSQLMTRALQHAGDRIVGIISNERMVSRYARDGFVTFCKTGCNIAENLDRFIKPTNPCIVPAVDVLPEDLENFDRRYFPANRGKFLHTWIRLPESASYAFVENGKVRGYGAVRRCADETVAKLGPIYAEEKHIARELASTLLQSLPGLKKITFETMEANPAAGQLTAELGLTLLGYGDVMFRNGVPKFDISGVFACISGMFG